MIIKSLIRDGVKFLKKKEIKTAILDAEIILSNLIQVSREDLAINDHRIVTNKVSRKFKQAIVFRSKLKPVAQIINKKEFWSSNFSVGNNTLIPRPETELLVEAILKIYKNKRINFLDIGTGSGCILFSLLKELRNSRGTGIDINPLAVSICKINCKKFQLFDRARIKCISVDDFFPEKFDLIVSNPPYVSTREIQNLGPEVSDYEPYTALNGGIDGLDLIKKVIYKSTHILKVNGTLALEVNSNQYLKVAELLNNNGFRIKDKVTDFKTNIRCILSTKVK